MSEEQNQDSIEVPTWIINQIGKLTLELEVLKAENQALQAMLTHYQDSQENSAKLEG